MNKVIFWYGKPLPDDPEQLKAIIKELLEDHEREQLRRYAAEVAEINAHADRARARLNDPRHRSIIGLLVDAFKLPPSSK